MALSDVDKAYGDNIVYRGLNVIVERGERVALVGVNGAGKSTLLKILAGVLPVDGGARTLGAQVSVHYYAQHQIDALDPARTVLEELEAAAPEAVRTRLRTILGSFLFSGDSVEKRVAVLSGGEKARLALARMLVRPAALLCLDEPTNHLDLASRGVLEDALAEFAGTIVFISHDRYFINRLATKVVEISGGRLHAYPGSYDDYLARAAAPAPARGTARPLELRQRLRRVEEQIAELERQIAELNATLGDPALYADGGRVRAVTAAQRDAQAEVAWLLREWEALSAQVAEHD